MTAEADSRVKEAFYKVAKAMEMGEVPLLVASPPEQWAFLEFVPSLAGGDVVYSSADDADAQLIVGMATPGRLFLVLDEPPPPSLAEPLLMYMENRDPLVGTPSATNPDQVHAEHRLVLIAERDVVASLHKDVRDIATVVSFPTD